MVFVTTVHSICLCSIWDILHMLLRMNIYFTTKANSVSHWRLCCLLRMTCFLWRWEVSCIISVSRELYKFSGSTTMSPTAWDGGHLTRCTLIDTREQTWIIGPFCTIFCTLYGPVLHFHLWFIRLFSVPYAHRTIFHLQRFPSGPTTEWWSGCGLPTSLNTLLTWEAVVCMEAWWWESLLLSGKRTSSSKNTFFERSTSPLSSGPRTSV